MIHPYARVVVAVELDKKYAGYNYVQIDYDDEFTTVEDKKIIGMTFFGRKKYETTYRDIYVINPFTVNMMTNGEITDKVSFYYGADKINKVVYWRYRFDD